MSKEVKTFDEFLKGRKIEEAMPANPDAFGGKVGVESKNSHLPLAQPSDGPIGDLTDSAYANLNVPTRKIPKTNNGSLGCAAAVSIMFYRATGYQLNPGKDIELSTSKLWKVLNTSSDFKKIPDWRTNWKPGDIIITARGTQAGHAGIVVDNGKIISNSSGGFNGDQKGQIEMNYSIKGWEKVAKRNPEQTALFRYVGKFKENWSDPDGTTKPTKKTTKKTKKAAKRAEMARQYLIWDKDNKRTLIAKYKKKNRLREEHFRVYTKRRDKVGEVYMEGSKIILKDNKGTRDVTEGRVGEAFKKLFDRARRSRGESSSDKVDVVMASSGDIKHSYTGEQAKNINLIIEEAKKAGVTNTNSIIAILSVIGKESNYIPKSEKMNYTPQRLAEVWGKFSKTGKAVPKGQGASNYNELAVEYAGNPEKLANFVYSDKYGNGPEESGDGWKYRGRGFNQITFKGTYEKYSKITGKDLVNNPDLLNDPKVAAEAAVKFLLNRFEQKGIDPNSFDNKQLAINQFAGANAGWGKDPSNAIANANKYAPNFQLA